MAKRQAQGGRPGKGPRDLMVTRVSIDLGQSVRNLAIEQDWSYSDTLAALIQIGLRHLDELPHQMPAGQQEALPLTKAS
jgi:hypothetical protein